MPASYLHPAGLPTSSTSAIVTIMFLTVVEMTQLAARARTVDPKPPWRLSDGWPQVGTVWRVEPVPLAIELLIAQGRPPERLCRALTNTVPGAYQSPWCFVPGDAEGEIWLVRPPAGWVARPMS
jgi:hypothetical protein